MNKKYIIGYIMILLSPVIFDVIRLLVESGNYKVALICIYFLLCIPILVKAVILWRDILSKYAYICSSDLEEMANVSLILICVFVFCTGGFISYSLLIILIFYWITHLVNSFLYQENTFRRIVCILLHICVASICIALYLIYVNNHIACEIVNHLAFDLKENLIY